MRSWKIRLSGRGLRRTCEQPCGREQRAFASCGPLRPFRARMKKEELKMIFGSQPAEHACDDKEQRHGTNGPILTQSLPAARGRLRAAGRYATEFTGKYFYCNRQLRVYSFVRMLLLGRKNRSRRDRRAAARGGRRRPAVRVRTCVSFASCSPNYMYAQACPASPLNFES